jgi:uncharacterized coiled-coil DUF342 family protein
LAELTAEVAKLTADRGAIQEKIDAAMQTGKNSAMGTERDELQKLRKTKGDLIEQKKAIRGQLDQVKTTADKLNKDRKDTKSNIRFTTLKEIEDEVARLQKLQETTSMSLQEEKKLIKEMDALKASKEHVKKLKSNETDMEGVKNQKKDISAMIADKDKEIDAISKEIETRQNAMKAMSEKETGKREVVDKLFKERDDLKKAITIKLKEKDAVRAEYREKNNEWFNNQRAVKAQRQMQWEAEKKKSDEERAEKLKLLEAEEAKKIPYEEEQALCEYLAQYLERTFITGASAPAEKVGAVKKDDVVAVKEDPFAGKMAVKKTDDEEFFSKGKGKKKRSRAPKPAAKGPFTLNIDSFEQFGLLGLVPPTNFDAVEQSVKDLREKKDWYSKQPRGSVPTAKDIRKENEKQAAKLRQAAGGSAAAGSVTTPKGKFAVATDEFAPLGKGASTAVDASSWGQKPAAAPVAAAATEDNGGASAEEAS